MKKIAGFWVALLLSSNGYANENWTGEVGKITVFEDGSAYLFISNPRNGPGGAFNCGQYNIVYLGVKNTPANKALLAEAMMVYVAGKTIRFGVRGSGDSCETMYLTAE